MIDWLVRRMRGPTRTPPEPPLLRPKPTTEAERERTLELVNSELLLRNDRVLNACDRVDTKASVILGVAAVGLPVVAVVHGTWLWAQIGAVVALLATAGVSIRVLYLARLPDTPSDDFFFRHYRDRSRYEVLGALVAARHGVIQKNVAINERKAAWWLASLVVLFIGVVLTGLSFVGASGADDHGRSGRPTGHHDCVRARWGASHAGGPGYSARCRPNG